MFNFTDSIELVEPRKTADGYLVADARVARTGIQSYFGFEVGMADKGIVSVWRPEESVFSKDSMASFSGKPVTSNHPSTLVDASTWKEHSIGGVGGSVARDGEFIVVPLSLMDAQAVSDYESGKKELSAGYSCDLEFTSGITPTGETYDAIQKNIKVNHVALVKKGRAGSQCRIGDQKPMETKTMLKIVVDGITIETTEQGADALRKLQSQLAGVKDAVSQSDAAHAVEIAAKDKIIASKDAELGTKDAEIAKLTDSKPSDVQLDALAMERAAVITKAKTFGDVKTEGMTNAEIRKAAVTLQFGDEKIKDKSDDYVQALFDNAADKHDPVANSFVTPTHDQFTQANVTDSEKAFNDMAARTANAWQGDIKNA